MNRSTFLVLGLAAAGAVGAVAGLPSALATPRAASATPAAEAFAIDSVHSSATFAVKHLSVSTARGRFNTIAGSFLLDPENAPGSSVQVTIQADSIDTNSANRNKHLSSPDFFSVKEFPTLSFTSTSVTKAGDNTYQVTGDFSLHGVTKPITAAVTSGGVGKGMRGGEVSGLDATFTIKRSDYGMNFMVGPVGDEVTITVTLEGGRP